MSTLEDVRRQFNLLQEEQPPVEFWGIEVAAGKSIEIEPDLGMYLNISLASLDIQTMEEESSPIVLYLDSIGKKQFVIGTLSHNCTDISFDLVFKKKFTLFHSGSHESVFFSGYKFGNHLLPKAELPRSYGVTAQGSVPDSNEPPRISRRIGLTVPADAARKIKRILKLAEEGQPGMHNVANNLMVTHGRLNCFLVKNIPGSSSRI